MSIKRQARQPLPISNTKKSYNHTPSKWAAAIFLFIAGILMASLIINFSLPSTVSTLDIPALNPKLEDMVRQGIKYDFVFLGSSRVFRGVDPAEIDAEARKQACRIKSYNLGIGGLSTLEQKYILNRLFESGIDIGTLFIEPYSVSDSTLDGYISDRRRYFYSWNNLADLLLDQSTMPAALPYKLRNLSYLLFGYMREQVGVGRLSSLLFPKTPEASDIWNKPIDLGFMPLDDEFGQEYDLRRQQFTIRSSKFEKIIERATNNPTLINSSGNRFELVLGVTEIIRNNKIKPAIIFMPSPRYILQSRDLEERLANEATETLPIINLNNPEVYGELFEMENYFDSAHLNRRGAKALARFLAPVLCALQGEN